MGQRTVALIAVLVIGCGGDAMSSSGGDGGNGDGSGGGGQTLSDRYPGDEGIASDPAVLFFDDFEAGWGRWDGPMADTQHLFIEQDSAVAHAGQQYLRSTVTTQQLQADQYISASPRVTFDRRVDQMYWRFYARFPNIAPNPHHWIRTAAGNATFNSSGLANTVPAGDEGFWFDFDIDNDNIYNFYVYWHAMRSGRCDDGTAVPGCEGDQGTTYYYGNVFQPPAQTAYPRDAWVCIEIQAKANATGAMDGELAFYIDDALIEHYRIGNPIGTWLRAQFHTGGCSFSSCTAPVPFEGFNFRTSAEVGFKSVFLDAYYQRDSNAAKRGVLEGRGLTVSDENTIYYDDLVVATERIGCRR